MHGSGKKFFWTVIVLLLLFYIISNPHSAAAGVHGILLWLKSAANAIIQFVGSVFNG
jgi:hypothetical protein